MQELLKINNITIKYKSINNINNQIITAVDNVYFDICREEIYALAGESGCGKSTIAKSILKLIKPQQGEILFNNKDIFNQTSSEKRIYTRNVQMIFQNPYSSFNPKQKIKHILSEPLDINTALNKTEKLDKIKEILSDVGLQTDSLEKYPHEFSGGQRQRIAIARALILNPKLLVADEPVSALDASIQAQILNLLKDLQHKKRLSILFISHDMNVIKYIADRVGIMQYGKIIEENYTNAIFKYPKNEYTKTLLDSVPVLR